MIVFFKHQSSILYAVASHSAPDAPTIQKLSWLLDNAEALPYKHVDGQYIGPRAAMVTPWSTNAVEITQNMGITGIRRIEFFTPDTSVGHGFDPMLSQRYNGVGQDVFDIHLSPSSVQYIDDIRAYNISEGLALSDEEIRFLEDVARNYDRKLTDSEVFGFSQINSEHCRHKIFNGTFVIDGQKKEKSLFGLIKDTFAAHPNGVVSAYKDNVTFFSGPETVQFAPEKGDEPSFYRKTVTPSVLSLKAETHNFPTTVEPFNGAATGSGGEIRDRLAGGRGSLPLAGTAIYMTAYPRLSGDRKWEQSIPTRPWLYQTPADILIKASNGASDFGNKFGQPLITGSVLTFEHAGEGSVTGFDKVIMLAGGVGYGKATQYQKGHPEKGDVIVVLGGDNYRIGMGGAAVSSADTGALGSGIELNAVQRSNPEMQKRVANVIRAMVESDENTIVSIHDHGAGGHLNCLSELAEEQGAFIEIDHLPVGDPTLSAKEILGNESQERMGLVMKKQDLATIRKIADRERAPLYEVGTITGDHRLVFASSKNQSVPFSLMMDDLFGASPKMIMEDVSRQYRQEKLPYDPTRLYDYLAQVLQLEAVACKDWLTNKVDRCVGGRVAKQQCCGPIQLPLNNCGVMALDYDSGEGIATSVGHAPVTALIDPAAGSRQSIGEALTNIVWAPLANGISSVVLSANWMWPCKNPGEDARLYEAVEACSRFAVELGIPIPTGKDSLSMTQKYGDRQVLAPGTVIISAAAHCSDITRVVEPVLQPDEGGLFYCNLSGCDFETGGSSLAQVLNGIGQNCPDVKDASLLAGAFAVLQTLIRENRIIAGHDIGSGGLITTLLEMCFPQESAGVDLDLSAIGQPDAVRLLFSENIGVVFQAVKGHETTILARFADAGIPVILIGRATGEPRLHLKNGDQQYSFDIPEWRDIWYNTSRLLDSRQSGEVKAEERFQQYKKQPLRFTFPSYFTGVYPDLPSKKPVAAIIREKGSNSERELAHALYLAGFDVRDVHMTDLMTGRETLQDVHFIGAVGGFSNSDVLGSAKGWAGAFRYNENANAALRGFFERSDTLSVGICNGCQLFIELGLIHPDHDVKPRMHFNDSRKHESAFTSVKIEENHSVMLSTLAGCKLGVWISHGEGKFILPKDRNEYHIAATYGYDSYPANPNGSDYNAAMVCSNDGRHLVMMPHIERSVFQWNWACYPYGRTDAVSPWLEAFVNARRWLEQNSTVL